MSTEEPNREELLGDAIRALIRGDIKCSDDLPPEKRPVHVSARRAFGAVYDLVQKRNAGVAMPRAAFYLATHDEVTPTEGNEPRVLKHEHVESYLAAGWKVQPAAVAVCPECEAAHGVETSVAPSFDNLFQLAHAWAQECYMKGLGKPCDIDRTRGRFAVALRLALPAHGVAVGSDALHQQIMNLPCSVPVGELSRVGKVAAYQAGHRDARHAAAELAAAHSVRGSEGMSHDR